MSGWKSWLRTVSNFCAGRTFSPKANPLFITRADDNRPYIRVSILGKEIVALLDSGATHSIIGSQGMFILRWFCLKLSKSSDPSILTADGAAQTITGSLSLPINIGNTLRLLKVFVVPSLRHGLILGSDFCRMFNLTLNFESNSYFVGTTEVSVAPKKSDSFCKSVETINVIHSHGDLSTEQRQDLERMILRFHRLSWLDGTKLGRTNAITHNINTGDASPFRQRQYPLSPYMLKHLYDELDKMLALGVVRRSSSPWSSPILLVKKSNGEYRFCFDGRKLNSVTKRDSYPLPLVDHILNKLTGAQYLSSVDLKSAFWQIPLDESSCEKTAFVVPGRGLYEFTVMPFGLNNAPQTQQRLMDMVLGPELDPYVFVYLDDVIIATPTFEKHLEVLSEVYSRLEAAKLTINLDKCEFCLPSLKYLGFVVDREGLRTNPEKVEAMINYPSPKTATEIKRFVGLCSWYRRFIPHFSSITAPITALLKGRRKSQRIQWSEAAEESFLRIKQALVSAPVLAAPNFDKPFTIQCDASDVGLGCVLSQLDSESREVPVAFASRTLSRTERRYTATEKECLAVLFGVQKFRPYVEGTHFYVITDHNSLLWLHRLKDPVGRLARWAVKLQQFNMTIEHRKGIHNVVPDALSRAPLQVNLLQITEEDIDNDRWYRNMITIVGRLPDSFPLYDIIDGQLYYHVSSDFGFRNDPNQWKLVVPQTRRREVLRECHDEPTAGHLGIFKTMNRVMDLYYWPNMRRDIKKYVRRCRICAAQKVSCQARPGFMGKQKRVSWPWQVIACDIIGPMPKSARGNMYLLVVTDWFSKFTLLCPLRQASAEPISKFLEENVFLIYGAPQILLCDNGTEFTANKMKNLAQRYGVKMWINARYHSQVNFVERYNRTIGAAIRSYLDNTDHRTWDQEIQKVAFALRTAVNESTGFSPVFLNFGRHVPVNGEYYGRLRDLDEVNPDALREFHAKEMEELPEVYKEVQRRLGEAYQRNARSYNAGKRPADVYNVGDQVWKRNHTMSSSAKHIAAKLSPKFTPAIVRRAVSDLVYELEDDTGTNLGRWHVKDLKPYIDPESDEQGEASDSE